MINLKEDIKNYMSNHDMYDWAINPSNSIELSISLMMYVHKDQRRENGESYGEHLNRCYEMAISLLSDDRGNIDGEELKAFNLPSYGIEELCLIQDVLNFSKIKIEDLEILFEEYDYLEYFNKFIKPSLLLLTKNKLDNEEKYINKLLIDKSASLVKLIDLNDRLNIFDSSKFDENIIKRNNCYFKLIKEINDKWNFINNLNEFHKFKDKLFK